MSLTYGSTESMHSSSTYGVLFDNLPPEIRVMIFAACISSSSPTPVRGSNPSPALCDTPLTLSHVCQSWRDLILSTPQLWSRFAMEVNTSEHQCSTIEIAEKELEALQIWLSRSQSYPLEITLAPPSNQHSSPATPSTLSTSYTRTSLPDPYLDHSGTSASLNQTSRRLVDALRPHLRHVKSLRSSLPLSDVLQLVGESEWEGSRHLDPLARLVLPGLRNLHLDAQRFCTYGSTVVRSGDASQLPSDVGMGLSTWDRKVPWQQLTSLYLHLDDGHLPTLDECHGVLSRCDNLQSCTLTVDCTLKREAPAISVGDDSAFSDASSRLLSFSQLSNLSSLRQLHLMLQGGGREFMSSRSVLEGHDGTTAVVSSQSAGSTVSNLMDFLESVSSAHLTSLKLEWLVEGLDVGLSGESSSSGLGGDSGLKSRQGQRFVQFLSAMSRTLVNLDVSYLPLSQVDLMAALRHLSALEDLSIKYSLNDDFITDDFFKRASPEQQHRAADFGAQPASGALLPALRALYIQTSGDGCLTDGLIKFVRARWENVDCRTASRIERFHFSSMKRVNEELAACVQKWKDDGLDIDFETIRLF
ncbi:hypothetical protein AX16_003550 [Volvariella volvacea WC 439]|nr:hypothetical protein AX16_003550 [Volvariella volvacea WC 439]